MEEVFAGFVAGYLMAIIFTGLGALTLARARVRFPSLARAVTTRLSPVALAVPISLFSFLLWTAAGMILGLVYRGAEANLPEAGLGSPNRVYTAVVLIFALTNLVAVSALGGRRLYWPLIAFFLAFAAVFGWMLPHLAEAA